MKKFGLIWKAAAAATLIGLAAAGFAGCGGSKAASSAAADGGKKVIKVAHTNNYPPYDFINDKGESDGFEVAVIKEVAKKLPQYQFQYVPTSNDDLLIGVESGKYDIGTKGVWITEARKKKYLFTKNYIGASVIGLVIRKENEDQIKNIDDFAKFSGKLVPIAPQNAQYAVVDNYNKKHPEHPIKLVPSETFQIPDAYSWVLEGRYDAYFNIELSFKNNVLKDGAPYHQLADKLKFIRYEAIPTYPLINKKETQLAGEVDKALDELKKEGKIKELEQKYFGEEISKLVSKE